MMYVISFTAVNVSLKQPFKNIITFVCVHVYTLLHAMVYMSNSKDNLWESHISFHDVGLDY